MNEFIDSLPELPQDDILIEYGRADQVTRKAVTALLETDSVRWIIGTIDTEKSNQMTMGVGMYKCDAELLPPLVMSVLGAFSDPVAKDAVMSAISMWIARNGELVLKQVVDRARGFMDG